MLLESTAIPFGLSAVSYEAILVGGDENAKTWTLAASTTTMCVRDNKTLSTEDRNSRDNAGCRFKSSQIMTLFCGNLGVLPPPTNAK